MYRSGILKLFSGIVCCIVLSSYAVAAGNQRVEGVRAILENGNPELTIKSAHTLLKSSQVTNDERRSLLEMIARAEEMRTSFHDYSDVSRATQAWSSLLKEFPADKEAAAIRWRIAWLYWRQGKLPAAKTAAEAILEKHPAAKEAGNAELLLARIAIRRNRMHTARKHLLQYTLGAGKNKAAQALGLAWLAVVDFSEKRPSTALKGMRKAIQLSPDIMTSNAKLESTYIRLLYIQGYHDQAMRLSEHFFKQYINTPYAPLIRLIHANLLAQKGDNAKAVTEYDELATSDAESSVGRKAFMRKLMLQHRKTSDVKTLKPVLAALQRMAAENQLSDIEAESMLDQAQLWERLSGKLDKAVEKSLGLYARTAAGHYPEFSATALRKGTALLRRQLKKRIRKNSWLQTVVLWKRFPQLRSLPPRKNMHGNGGININLGVAHAMRMLMQFSAAEEMLNRLYQQTRGSVIGQRVMLELTQLWLDRGDVKGYSRVMHWLDNHEFTLYRPEMQLVAAGMLLAKGKINAASQTLHAVSPEDLALETRANYWQTEARIDEALSRWHSAAKAWGNQARYNKSDLNKIWMNQADALFRAEEFAAAEKTYLKIPKEMRQGEWQYRVAMTEYHIGKWTQAEERLQRLVEEKNAGEYANMARLELAEKRARALLEQQ